MLECVTFEAMQVPAPPSAEVPVAGAVGRIAIASPESHFDREIRRLPGMPAVLRLLGRVRMFSTCVI